jgi:pimeloyl-ACP methyl ester carboxylesterase
MQSFQRAGLTFDVLSWGPSDGPLVVLLHGFPQNAESWGAVAASLAEQGYRVLAPNQRGYSPGARPRRRRDYRTAELVADVEALLDAAGADQAHLVGHDWGSAAAWSFAAAHPSRLLSLTAVSVPHPAGFLRAMLTSRQGLSSWYMGFFQLPRIPEKALSQRLAEQLRKTGLDAASAARDARFMATPGTLTAALNWYRAIPFANPRSIEVKVSVPTLFIWSDSDAFVRRSTAESCRDWVTGPYRFEQLTGVSHWIPDEAPAETTAFLLDHFAAHG